MTASPVPVEWREGQAILVLPEHIDVSNAGEVREQLLTIINRAPGALIVDMTGTASCDHAGMDTLARAHQRAAVSGTRLRLAVSAPVLLRVLGVEGIDRLISIYPSVEAALAAGPLAPGEAVSSRLSSPANGRPRVTPASEQAPAGIAPALLWQLIDALGDALVLCTEAGEIVLTNRRCAELFGYQRDDLVGRPVELLVPGPLRADHEGFRDSYARAPVPRPMSDRARLVGVRADGATIPVDISLSPVPTANGHFILAVIRDSADTRRRQDLAELARAAAAEQAERGRELLDRVVGDLFQVGLSLQAAAELPAELARERITDALARLDETIREIRDHAFDAVQSAAPDTD